MKQLANRRWQFYLPCELMQNLYKKKRMRIKPSALLVSGKSGTTKNKRWKLLRKKGKLIRLIGNNGKQKDSMHTGKERRVNIKIRLSSLNAN